MADTKSLKNAVEMGRESFLKGDLARARECYLKQIADHPEDADAFHALAAVEQRDGQIDKAESYLRQAIVLNRYGVGFQNSLGNLLVTQKRLREAEAAYFEELRMRPEFSLSHNQLGVLMLQNGNIQRAIKHFQSALQFRSNYAEAATNLGLALCRDNQLPAAEAALIRALDLDNQNSKAHANLGHVKLRAGDISEAAVRFERALALNAQCAEAIRGIAQLRLLEGKVQEAIAAFNKVLELSPDDLESVRVLASLWERQSLWGLAEQYYKRAHDLATTDLDILNSLAKLQVARGRTSEAIDNFEKALQIRSSDQVSLSGYGNLKAATGDTKLALSKLAAVVHSGRAESSLISAYARLLGASARRRDGINILEQHLRTRISEEEKCELHFTLGDLLDADSSYDLAFHNYRKANQLKRAKFDADRFSSLCQRIETAFSAEAMAAAPRAGSSGEGLVFMVGMPRGGVHVIEQQLQAHDEIVSMGGSAFIEMSAYRLCSEQALVWPPSADQLEQGALSRFTSLYCERARLVADETNLLLDATWRNFLYLGLIELMFPKAKVVYCARDFRDIALSCFFTHFSAQAGSTSFAYNLRDIVSYINAHRRLMKHWSSVLTLPMHVVTYERMILDHDAEAGKLLDFLGVNNPLWLSEEAREDELPKPSSLKSISLRRFRHYKYHLEGLVEELELAPDQVF
ncbi:MAG: sulfotransferase [Gammaproteobacteria bacterium]